jgi:hypothetical protein
MDWTVQCTFLLMPTRTFSLNLRRRRRRHRRRLQQVVPVAVSLEPVVDSRVVLIPSWKSLMKVLALTRGEWWLM